MGKRTVQFKKARVDALAGIREQLVQDKDSVKAIVALQKNSLEVYTKEAKDAMARFTENTENVISKCDALTKYLDDKIASIDAEIANIENEPLTEEYYEDEYNKLKNAVEGMYTTTRLFQNTLEEGDEKKPVAEQPTPTPAEEKTEVVAEPKPSEEKPEPTPEYVSEGEFTTEPGEYDELYKDVVEAPEGESAPAITVVESNPASTPAPVQAEPENTPGSLSALLNRAKGLNI